MKCLICNKEYKNNQALARHITTEHKITTKEYYDKYLKKDGEGICPICGKETPFLKLSKGYQKHCSCKCAQNNPKVNNFITNNPQKNPEIKEKTKHTMINRYGGFGFASDDIRQKSENTLINKIGVSNIYLKPDIQEKARKNSHTNTSNEIRYQTYANNIRKIAKDLDSIWVQDLLDMTKSSGWYQSEIINIIKYNGYLFVKNEDIQKVLDYDNNTYKVYSIKEKEIVEYIKSIYSGEVIENSKKIISPKELDIYLPELNLAIEFNGLYFHSLLNNTPKDYHLNKSLLCREKGIRLIHIYEFEDLEKQKQLLKDLILGIDNYPKNDFNKNNLLKNIPNPEIIFNDNRLIIYGAGFLK